MSKVIELINQILEMDKELESLRNKVTLLESGNKSCYKSEISEDDPSRKTSRVEKIIYDCGLRSIYEKTVYSWRCVIAKRNKKGEIKYTPYDEYLNDVINKDRIPQSYLRMK